MVQLFHVAHERCFWQGMTGVAVVRSNQVGSSDGDTKTLCQTNTSCICKIDKYRPVAHETDRRSYQWRWRKSVSDEIKWILKQMGRQSVKETRSLLWKNRQESKKAESSFKATKPNVAPISGVNNKKDKFGILQTLSTAAFQPNGQWLHSVGASP